MKNLVAAAVMLVVALVTAQWVLGADETETQKEREEFLASDQCIVCHREQDNMPDGFLEQDIHIQRGLSCAGCHGGDPTSDDEDIAMSEEAGFIGAPSRSEIPEFCGRCHSSIEFMRKYQPRIATDQVSQYYTSIHGMRLKEGDKKVAECASCHSAHAILSAKDARSSVYPLNVPGTCKNCHANATYMSSYKIPTNQFEQYARSVHGVALLKNQDTGAPACNDCHGNHGALPPGLSSIAQVCGNCHVNNAQYFSASAMADAFKEQELGGCEACHGNHLIEKTSDDMVGVGKGSVCMDCHDAGDDGYKAAQAIRSDLKGLVDKYALAEEKQKEVRIKGMDDVEIGFLLQEAHQSLIQARTLVHTFDPATVRPKTEEGTKKAEAAITLALGTIRDYYVRRRGFGMATVFITIVVIALFFKIRQMET